MINRYDILQVQLLQLQLLCCEAIERVYVRDKLGQFAKTNQDEWMRQGEEAAFDIGKKTANDLMQEAFSNLSPETQRLLQATKSYQSVDKRLERVANLKQNLYPALGVTNEGLIGSAVNAGMNSPEFIKNIALPVALISNFSPDLDDLKKLNNVKEVREFGEAQLKEKEKEYEGNILAQGATTFGRSYLRHQRNMDKMRHLEDYGETEWVGQMGRVGAFGVDAAWNVTTLLGAAAFPMLRGARTLEAIAPAIQVAAEKRVVIPGLVKETYDLSKDVANEKPEKVLLAFAAGAVTGKALELEQDFAEKHPELAEKSKVVLNELQTAAEKANDFTDSVDEAMDKTGVDELFEKDDLTLDEFVEGAKEIYQAIPQEQKEVLDKLSDGASEILQR
jgi:hypothetical protein